jgi:hypothetical protein
LSRLLALEETDAYLPLHTHLFGAYGVAVDATHNLIYAASVVEGRLSVIDRASEYVIDFLHIRRYIDNEAVWLYVIAANPDAGPGESHLMLIAEDEKREVGQLLLIPKRLHCSYRSSRP